MDEHLSNLLKSLLNKKNPNVSLAVAMSQLKSYMGFHNTSEEEILNHISALFSNPVQVDTYEDYEEFQIQRFLRRYIPPFLILIGLVGNVMSFFILRHKSMARHSTNVFLAALSIADLIVLFVGLFRLWIGEILENDFQTESDFMCKFVNLLTYSSSQFSAWLVLAVTVERYIVVCHALQATRWCSRERARKTVVVLAIIFILINLHLIWTTGIRTDMGRTKPECEGLRNYEFLVRKVWPWIDAALYSTIPVISISLFNILIIRQVISATHSRRSLQHAPLNKIELKRRSKNKSSKLTIMLLTISFAFCVTTLPMNVVIIASYQVSNNPKEIAKFWLVRTTAELLMYLNHSMNFFLYCATGHKFRSIVLRIVCRISNFSDHSQHIYCSGGYNGYASGGCIHRKVESADSSNNDDLTNQVTAL
ncbi:probable G-protein coupled receptor 139 [Saccostrea cucullata]|uniref:probable G-protein coupled receptor 139 n=1 Tax=Saccostrea cuccullata TaxID=36930 RepID=UPI002ED29765